MGGVGVDSASGGAGGAVSGVGEAEGGEVTGVVSLGGTGGGEGIFSRFSVRSLSFSRKDSGFGSSLGEEAETRVSLVEEGAGAGSLRSFARFLASAFSLNVFPSR